MSARSRPDRIATGYSAASDSSALSAPGTRAAAPGLVDDVRERAVEVEEQRRAARRDHACDLAERAQRVGKRRHPPVDGPHGHVGELADHHVGTAPQQIVAALPGAIDADHQPEAAGPARGHPGLGVLDDHATAGPRAQPAGGLEQHRGIGLSGQSQLLGGDTVDPHREQLVDSRRFEHRRAVAARRVHRRAHTDGVQPAYQGHGGLEGGHSLGDPVQVQPLLAVAQPADGVLGLVGRRAPRQRNAPGCQKVPHTVVARFTVDEMPIIGGGEGIVVLGSRAGTPVKVLVEHLRPGRLVQRRGVGDHTVEIEQDGVVVARIDRHRQADIGVGAVNDAVSSAERSFRWPWHRPCHNCPDPIRALWPWGRDQGLMITRTGRSSVVGCGVVRRMRGDRREAH